MFYRDWDAGIPLYPAFRVFVETETADRETVKVEGLQCFLTTTGVILDMSLRRSYYASYQTVGCELLSMLSTEGVHLYYLLCVTSSAKLS